MVRIGATILTLPLHQGGSFMMNPEGGPELNSAAIAARTRSLGDTRGATDVGPPSEFGCS